MTPVGSTIFKNVVAEDADAGVNGLVEYSIAPGDGAGIGYNDGVGRDRIATADGYGYFSINLPHQGQVTVNRTLDYERTQRYLVTILASVSFTFFIQGSTSTGFKKLQGFYTYNVQFSIEFDDILKLSFEIRFYYRI